MPGGWVIAYLVPPAPTTAPCHEGEGRGGGSREQMCGSLSLAYVADEPSGLRRIHNMPIGDDFCRSSVESQVGHSVGEDLDETDYELALRIDDADGDARNEITLEMKHLTHTVCPTGSGTVGVYAVISFHDFRRQLFVDKERRSGSACPTADEVHESHVAMRDVNADGHSDVIMRRVWTNERCCDAHPNEGPRRVRTLAEYERLADDQTDERPCVRYAERTVRHYEIATDSYSEPVPLAEDPR